MDIKQKKISLVPGPLHGLWYLYGCLEVIGLTTDLQVPSFLEGAIPVDVIPYSF